MKKSALNRQFICVAVAVFASLLSVACLAAGAKTGELDDYCLIHQGGRQNCFIIELANNPDARKYGLMNRQTLAPRHGMLFDFDESKHIGMWMKNTLIPLDMVFLDETGAVVFIHRRAQPHSLEVIAPPMPVRFTLELNAGDVKRFDIRRGDRLYKRTR